VFANDRLERWPSVKPAWCGTIATGRAGGLRADVGWLQQMLLRFRGPNEARFYGHPRLELYLGRRLSHMPARIYTERGRRNRLVCSDPNLQPDLSGIQNDENTYHAFVRIAIICAGG
jgi:hypothetical protein